MPLLDAVWTERVLGHWHDAHGLPIDHTLSVTEAETLIPEATIAIQRDGQLTCTRCGAVLGSRH